MKLSAEQLAAVEAFERAYLDYSTSQLVIAGLAGTGKTTIIRELVERVQYLPGHRTVAVCTPTGKAAHVLRCKGVEAITLHSLLYYPRQAGAKINFVDNGEELPDIVIVDEASMLDVRIVEDLRARVAFVCYVGDHGQLEPVGDDPELMKYPDVKLETIHRQAAGSPIIHFAHRVRLGKAPMSCKDASGNIDRARVVLKAPDDLHEYDVILCAFNKTRVRLNAWVRRRRGFKSKLPEVGEQVICLRNNKEWQVFNGMTGVVKEIDARRKRITVATDDGLRAELPFVPRQFGEEKTLADKSLMRKGAPTLWDFGYCLTCHKAQGSEYDRVAVYDEVPSSWAVDRWRYTAATRAAKQLLWITK